MYQPGFAVYIELAARNSGAMNQQSYVLGLIDLLVEGKYEDFMSSIKSKESSGTIWVSSVNELKEFIANSGCDVPPSTDGAVKVTSPSTAEGEPWLRGWLIHNSFSGAERYEVQLPLNGEWSDLHIYFDFESQSEKPMVSFIGVP